MVLVYSPVEIIRKYYLVDILTMLSCDHLFIINIKNHQSFEEDKNTSASF
jgi:hypothetical protein